MSDVNNSSNNSTVISGTNDADQIMNTGSDVTIIGTAGGDMITLDGSKQWIDYTKVGIRNVSDTVFGFDSNDSIRAFDGYALSHDFSVQGSDIIVGNVASYLNDSVTLKDAAGKTINVISGKKVERVIVSSDAVKQKLNGTTGIDCLINVSTNATINAKNFAVDNRSASVLVIGSNMVESINNIGDQATLRSGDGNDFIRNTASKVLLESGTGNDEVFSSGSNVTIKADKGDDSITVDNNFYIAPIDYYPTLAGGIAVASSVTALADEQIATRINQVIASLNDGYLTNRADADGLAITSDNATLISDANLKAKYSAASGSNADVKAAMETNISNLNTLIGDLELIELGVVGGSTVPIGKSTVKTVRAESESTLQNYYKMNFARPDGTTGAITTSYGTVDTGTSLADSRAVMTSLIDDINEKIRSISLMPDNTAANPLDQNKIYLNLTSNNSGSAAALAKIKGIQFATDGSDLYEKYLEFAALASDDKYAVQVYVNDGASGNAWLTSTISSVLMSSWINLRQPIDIYNFIKTKAFYMSPLDQSDLDEATCNELANAIDTSAVATKTEYDQYYSAARDLYNHLQAKAYNSTFDVNAIDLSAVNNDAYRDLLELISSDDQSKFISEYNSAAAMTDYLHARQVQNIPTDDEDEIVPLENITINAGDGNDVVYSSASSVTIDGVGGNDTIQSSGNDVTIIGGAGNDYIRIKDDNVKFEPINYYPTLAGDIEVAASVNALSDSQLATRIGQFVATLNDGYLKNRENADGLVVTRTNTELLSDQKLAANYGLSSGSNAEVKAAMDDNLDNLIDLIGDQELIQLSFSGGSFLPTGKITVNDVRANDVANGENMLNIYYTMGFERPNGTSGALTTSYGTVDTGTSLGTAREIMTSLLTDINKKIGSISLMPVDTTANPLDSSKIYLNMTANNSGSAGALATIRSIQFATDGSDLLEKYQQLAALSSDDKYRMQVYLSDGASGGAWITVGVSSVITGSWINLRQPIDIYNFIKTKAFYTTTDDNFKLSTSNYNELANAVDTSAEATKKNYDQYYGAARDLYNHLQATAYRSTLATDGSDLLVMNTDGYNDLLALIPEGDQSKFISAYGSAASFTDKLHERQLQTVEGEDTAPSSNVKIGVNAGDGNDSIEVVLNDGKLAGDEANTVKFVTIYGGKGNDTVNFVSGSNRLYKYATGDGADVILGANSTDMVQITGSFTTVESGKDILVKASNGTIRLVDAAGSGVSVVGYTADGKILLSGMDYNAKKANLLTVMDPFTGTVDAATVSNKITMIDATASSLPVVLKSGDASTAIKAGTGDSTLIGGAKDDKLYGGNGDNTFVYTVGKGKDGIFNYVSKDLVSLEGASAEGITFTDKNSIITLTFDEDKNSKLTINKIIATDTVVFDIGGKEFIYGSVPSGATFDGQNKNALYINENVTLGATDTIKAADIASTLKEINAVKYEGTVNIVGNANPNILRASKGGSTLYGGHTAKAYVDKMYGGDGADVFVYAAGDGADVVCNLNGGQGDYVLLKGIESIDAKKDVNVTATKITVTINKQKLTLENYDGEVRLLGEDGTELYKTGLNLPEGIAYADTKKTILAVNGGAALEANSTLDAGEISPNIKEMKIDGYAQPVALVGNSVANVLRAGDGGSTLYGGKGADNKPSADKLHGSTVDAADVFVYASGDGADVIYNFDGSQGDYVLIKDVAQLDSTTVVWNGSKVIATIDKQKLTLENPQNIVRFVGADGTELYRTGVELPKGIGYDAKRTTVTIGSSASDVEPIDLNDGFPSTIKEVNAKDYTGAIKIVGNGNSNVLRAGSGGSTLDGSHAVDNKGVVKATSDKLYGGSGKDVFILDASLGGTDQVYSYSAAEGDIISITGAADDLTIDNTNFKLNGTKAVLTVGKSKITVNDLVDSHQINVAYGDGKTFSFASMPGGVEYSHNYKKMNIAGAFAGDFNIADYDYMSTAVTIDASASTNNLDLTGSTKAKFILGGAGKTTMHGTTGADTFTCGTGSDVIVYNLGDGKDVINGFDSDTDIVKIVGNKSPIAVTNFTEKNSDIVLTVGTGSITFKDAPRGVLNVEYDGGSIGYKTLPLNTTYVAKTGALTLTKFFSEDSLDANDLDVTVKELNASALTAKTIDLQASSENTRMTLGKGGGTLRGGKGNDTMIGAAGDDVFVVGVGDDVIDKFTFKNDKIVINSELTDSTLKGSKDVEIKTADGSVWIKSVLGQEFTIINNGVEQKYKFTKEAKTLEAALVSSSSDESSASEIAVEAEDYWFLKSDDSFDDLGELIGVGTSADEAAIGLSDQLSKTFIPPTHPWQASMSTFSRKK